MSISHILALAAQESPETPDGGRAAFDLLAIPHLTEYIGLALVLFFIYRILKEWVTEMGESKH